MVRTISGAAVLVLGLAFAGSAQAQGFSAGGVGGIAALQGATASPGSAGGPPAGEVHAPAVRAAGPVAEARRRPSPTDVGFAVPVPRVGATGRPF